MRYKLFFIIAFFSISTSCNKFLETKPEDFLSPVNYYDTEAELNRALNGVYNRLVDGLGRMYSRGLCTFYVVSDEFFYTGTASLTNNMKVNDYDATHLDIGRLWEVIYQGIDRANLLLENVNKPEMDETKRSVIRGEALFLRAYYYYLLVDMFGGVPLKLTSTTSPSEALLPRSSAAEVLAQVTKDMKEAETLVNDISSYTNNERITKTAVQAILARVYLKMAGQPLNDVAKYNDALEYSNKVITSGKHSLNPSYSQIFINHSQDKYDIQECIWEIGMYGNKAEGEEDVAGFIGIENGLTCPDESIGFSGGLCKITARLWDAFETTDKRKDWCIAPYRWATAAGVTSKTAYTAIQIYDRTAGKWRREYEMLTPKARAYGPTNFPVIRYSDVLLMKAEAENAIAAAPNAAAYNAINQVRRRGYEVPLTTPNAAVDVPAGLDKPAFLVWIQNERMRELCFEGMRKHDLIRWGMYIPNMKSLAADIRANAPTTWKFAARAGENVTNRNVLFPIPSTEIMANKLVTQNPGW